MKHFIILLRIFYVLVTYKYMKTKIKKHYMENLFIFFPRVSKLENLLKRFSLLSFHT